MSEPSAIFTPAAKALRKASRCSPEAASARQHSAGARLRFATQRFSQSLVVLVGVRWLIASVGTYQTSCSRKSSMHSSSRMYPCSTLCAPRRIAAFTAWIGGVRHDLELAQLAHFERGVEFVLQQERMPVQVPRGTHDAARQVQLDVIDTVLDLLADRLDEAVRPVDSSV